MNILFRGLSLTNIQGTSLLDTDHKYVINRINKKDSAIPYSEKILPIILGFCHTSTIINLQKIKKKFSNNYNSYFEQLDLTNLKVEIQAFQVIKTKCVGLNTFKLQQVVDTKAVGWGFFHQSITEIFRVTRQLTHLDLDGNTLEQNTFDVLIKYNPRLQRLRFNPSEIHNHKGLASLTALKSFALVGLADKNKTIWETLMTCLKLEEIGNESADNPRLFLEQAGRRLTKIDQINWDPARYLNTIANFCSNITYLNLSPYTEAFKLDTTTTSEGLFLIAKKCTEITHLILNHAPNLKDQEVQAFKNLVYLDVSYCPKLTDDAFSNLTDALKVLKAEGCETSDQLPSLLAKRCPKLQVFTR